MSSQAGPSRRPGLIKLEQSVIERLTPAKLFKEAISPKLTWLSTAHDGYSARGQITSIAFDDTGDVCTTAGEDEQISLWDVGKGKEKRQPTQSRKYGIGQVRFTHKSSNILHTSTKGDHDIRYMSMHDNQYLAYFKGHTARYVDRVLELMISVRSIQMHPTKDLFISAGDDGTVRIWDLRGKRCQALMNDVGGSTIAAFDPEGTVFAVACSDLQAVMLYATDQADAPPFLFERLVDKELERASQPPRLPIFTSISFSKKGDLILIGTSSDVHYIIDGFDLTLHRRLIGHRGLEEDHKGNRSLEPRRGGSGEEVGWTADSRWVYSGSSDGSICFWDMSKHPRIPDDQRRPGAPPPPQTLQPTVVRKPDPSYGIGPSRAVRFNPRHDMLAVGGERMAFLLPERQDSIESGY